MRNRALHDALRDFALEAAALLTADLEAGAELPFDVEEAGGRRGGVLYSYRPLTAEFLRERWDRLTALPAFGPAARALGSGAAAYLRVRGLRGADAEPALRAMLERLYEDAAGFGFPEERFERTYAEVEATLYEHAMRVTVAAPMPGLRTQSDRVEVGDGLALVRGDWTDAPPEAVWPAAAEAGGEDAEPSVLCLFEEDVETSASLPLAEAAARFAALHTGLRLFEAGGVALGPTGFARADAGPWQRFALAAPAPARGPEWTLARAEEEDLRGFLATVARSRHGGAVAWALRRFELGHERGDEREALSDYLLALGALLDGADEAGRASLSLRLAALCAEERGRRAVQRRVELAFALERFLISGGAGSAYVDAIGSEPPAAIVAEIEGHLRALLRDVLCGYLDPDLRSVADDILLASSEPFGLDARRMRRDVEPPEPPTAEIEVRRLGAAGAGPNGGNAPGSVPTERDERVEPEDGELEPVEVQADAGVTPSADWDFDEDPDSYSAPI